MLLFVVGTALTGATLVFDEGTIGLLRGGVQLWRNMAMSAIKLAALPVTAVLLHDTYGVGISLAFVIATVGSMIPASIMLVRGGSRIFHRPDWQSLRRLLPVAINHNWLNLAMATPSRIIPIVVTVVVGGDKERRLLRRVDDLLAAVHGARPPGDRAVRPRVGVPRSSSRRSSASCCGSRC